MKETTQRFYLVSPIVIGAVISAVLALQAWTLKAVVDLKVTVAQLTVQVDTLQNKQINEHRNSLAIH